MHTVLHQTKLFNPQKYSRVISKGSSCSILILGLCQAVCRRQEGSCCGEGGALSSPLQLSALHSPGEAALHRAVGFSMPPENRTPHSSGSCLFSFGRDPHVPCCPEISLCSSKSAKGSAGSNALEMPRYGAFCLVPD